MNTSNESESLDKEPTDSPVERNPEIAEVDFEAEAAKLKDLALRARADLDNFRKRAIREKEDAIRYANNGLLEKFLPILDNFELGLDAAKRVGLFGSRSRRIGNLDVVAAVVGTICGNHSALGFLRVIVAPPDNNDSIDDHKNPGEYRYN
ncbi:MAG: nucleotide exchange factor GrpE [Alphaproteobacteria bacterium]|nr:nucleotide exchange factor GrpE [Alphaproteobacteria bacterium]